jgi:hypothetical protein
MDLLHGYGTIRSVTRWMLALLIAVFAASSAGDADAQAFKPKKAPAKGTAAKKAPAPAAKKTTAPRRVVTSNKAAKKRPSRAAQSGRADDLTPDSDAPSSKTTKDDDYVLIEDDDE